jgi:hypothetical protein
MTDSSTDVAGSTHGRVRVVSPDVRVAEVDGLILVMDLTTSAFYILDEQASRLWHVLQRAQGSVVAAKEAVMRGEASPPKAAAEFDDFVADCEARHFLVSAHPVIACGARRAVWPRPSRHRMLLTTRAWWWMLRIDLALRQDGFAAVYRRIGHAADVGPRTVSARDVDSARAAFLRAENFYLRRRAPNDCLARSLALCVFMRRLGVPVTHRIGARRVPGFQCHAWVEYEGIAMVDPPAQAGKYTLLASM